LYEIGLIVRIFDLEFGDLPYPGSINATDIVNPSAKRSNPTSRIFPSYGIHPPRLRHNKISYETTGENGFISFTYSILQVLPFSLLQFCHNPENGNFSIKGIVHQQHNMEVQNES
jgi:hypothetical protein